MNKNRTKNKFFAFLIALVIFFSPIFLSGCSLSGKSNRNGNTQTPSSIMTFDNIQTQDTDDESYEEEFDPRESLEQEEYDNYFKNYRITYQSNTKSRDNFNNGIINQNVSISQGIISELLKKYGISAIDKFSQQTYNVKTEANKLILGLETEYYDISSDYDYDENKPDFDIYKHKNALSEADLNLKNLILGTTLILAGYRLEDDDFDDIYEEYRQNIDEYINDEFKLVSNTSFSNLVGTISHLGYTELEVQQIEKFVCDYTIGWQLIDEDNSRFVTGYFVDNGNGYDFTLLPNDTEYNRFLNDETFAVYYNANFNENNITDDKIKKHFHVINEYATRYLALLSNQSTLNLYDFEMDGRLSDETIAVLIQDESDTYTNLSSSEKEQVTKAIYHNFINLSGNGFNTNFWGYNENGEIDKSLEGVGFVSDKAGHNLVSLRLPYFKNYVNNVHTIVNEELNKEVDQSSEEYVMWQFLYGEPYPYTEKYPNIPYTYFADYDNRDMLFYGDSGVAKMFSGFQCYQNMVLMPQAEVDVENGALFFVRELAEDEAHLEDGTTDGFGDFDITVYIRYYDATTQSYAVWIDSETSVASEFYSLGTQTIKYEETNSLEVENGENPEEYMGQNDDMSEMESDEQGEMSEDQESGGFIKNYTPTTFDFSIKDILIEAYINGQKNGNWTLEAFAEDTKLETHKQIQVDKEHYGNYFKELSTPDGNKVVVFDGKAVGSSSYIEFVFSTSKPTSFQFAFIPSVAYVPTQNS